MAYSPLPTTTGVPFGTDNGVEVKPVPLQKTRYAFELAVASGVQTGMSVIQTGSGQAVSQSSGNLLVTTGTTANAETIIRSTASWKDSLVTKWSTILSQRITNNNFYYELVDVIGDGLAVTVNSTTSITVTIPGTTWTSANVGQSVYIGAVQNISATAVPGRYAIASVSGTAVTFTVAGWPASGSGTCSLFGWNYYQVLYTGTTATSASYDGQGRGWNSGFTAVTINTTASPGHMGVMINEDATGAFLDGLTASSTATQLSLRGQRVNALPDATVPLFLQLRAVNGTSAPATTTTWTVGFAEVDDYAPQVVTLGNIKPTSLNAIVPTSIPGGVVINSGTVSTVTTVNTASLIAATVTDIASAAITTTTTSASVSMTNVLSASFSVAVTAVSGTTPTIDIVVQETIDNTNWYDIYHFERITTTGFWVSPTILVNGPSIRYVRTVAGTTPSFTMSLTRENRAVSPPSFRRMFDRSIAPNTLNSTTAVFNVGNANMIQIVQSSAAGASVAPVFTLEGSEDNTNWYQVGTAAITVTGTASTNSMNYTPIGGVMPKYARARVSTAGTSAVMNYICLTAKG